MIQVKNGGTANLRGVFVLQDTLVTKVSGIEFFTLDGGKIGYQAKFEGPNDKYEEGGTEPETISHGYYTSNDLQFECDHNADGIKDKCEVHLKGILGTNWEVVSE